MSSEGGGPEHELLGGNKKLRTQFVIPDERLAPTRHLSRSMWTFLVGCVGITVSLLLNLYCHVNVVNTYTSNTRKTARAR